MDARTLGLLAMGEGQTKPIADIHVHLYQPSRSGVAWPSPANPTLYKDFLPPTYKMTVSALGILGAGIVEASPWNDDTDWILDQMSTPASMPGAMRTADPFFPWYVAQLDITSADFIANLDKYTTGMGPTGEDHSLVAGLRVYLWNGTINADDPIQNANLAEVQKRGLTLDLISRGQPALMNETNPKAQVAEIATRFPDLRIIIDHMAGAKLAAAMPDPRWETDIALLASHKNIYIKFSAFFDMANATGDESKPWTAPKDMASYKPVFDKLFDAFGEDRMIWGSNFPVVLLAGTVDEEVAIAEQYLAQRTPSTPPAGGADGGTAGEGGAPPTSTVSARDKVMYQNAILFYQRLPPGTDPMTPHAMTLLQSLQGKTKPIIDTHIHEYQPSRSGVVWPSSSNKTLYQDTLPSECPVGTTMACQTYSKAIAGLNVLLTGVVEASPRNEDTDWVLSQLKGKNNFFSYAAQLDITSKDFIKNLNAWTTGLTADGIDRAQMVPGLRVYLWNGNIDVTDPTQQANLAEVQKRGMTIDLISRGQMKFNNVTNPKAQIDALAKAYPNLRIIIDHLGGAKLDSASPDPNWMSDIALLAGHKNIYMKFSAFFDTANASGDESKPWTAPTDPSAYTKIFDYLWSQFGADRLIFGSNWPVVNLAGTLAQEVTIAETYLATKTSAERDKVMFKNAILFYRRVPPPAK
jgi:predicted TIM-barrel fold metal-dependent hydrolase